MKKTILLAGAGMLALASAASAADSASAGQDVEIVTVYGKGETRQIQTVTQNDIALGEPGASPFQSVATLPGVNFQSADPFGSYEWSTRISVRGFNQNQLGFTLDGVPLGDMSYGNYNGLHISRAISSENIARSELAQGTGALGTASTSNLGGTLAFYSINPSETMGITAASAYGSNDTFHEYVRLDSGELSTGTRAYVSYSFQQSRKWKGDGLQKQQQINGKLIQDIGDSATVTGFLNYSVRRENDYQDMSLDMINRLGYNWDNISNNWPLAVTVANDYQQGKPFPAPFQTVDDAYYNASGLRNDVLGGVTADWSITKNLAFKVTGYGHNNTGRGLWWTPYVPTSAFIPGAAPISVRTTEYAISRYGVISSLTWTLGDHEIEGGVWYENNNFHQARRYYALAADGSGVTSLQFPKNPMATQWAFAFNTTTLVFHLQDTWQVTDALKVNFGFKTQTVNNGAHLLANQITAPFLPLSANQFTGGKIKTDTGFLPQAGVNYRFDDSNEVFADYSKNQRAFVSAATNGPFSTTQPGFNAIKNTLKPETSQTIEAGYRYNSDAVQAVLAGYYVMFKNRQLATQVGAGIVGNPSALSNVGSVTSKGIEAAATWHFWDKAWLSGSYAYNASTYDDNVVDGSGNVIMHTKDKTTVDAPKHILNAALNYDDGALFGNVDVSYMSKRYFTYENDQSVGGRTLVSLTAGYRLAGTDTLADGLELQVNVENLFDEKYISTIGSNGFGANGDNQTLLPGSPRAVFVSLKKQFP